MKTNYLFILLLLMFGNIMAQSYIVDGKTIKLEKSISGKKFVIYSDSLSSLNKKNLQFKNKVLKNEVMDSVTFKNLKTKPIYVGNFYKVPNTNKEVGVSNILYVKIKNQADTILLKQKAKLLNFDIVENNKFMKDWFTISCNEKTGMDALMLTQNIEKSGWASAIEPDFIDNFKLLNCPTNDEFFPNQWNLKNTGQFGGTIGVDINVCNAWEITIGNPNIIIAVIDNGVELTHEDLIANISPVSYDAKTNTQPSVVYQYSPSLQQLNPHGTQVAGIIGATSNNSIGVSGVCKGCKIMSISADFWPTSSLAYMTQQLADGINFAWQNGASVINNSWGRLLPSSIMNNAITNALVNGRNGKGCVVVFASGNDEGDPILYPANFSGSLAFDVLTVGAIDRCGKRKTYPSCTAPFWSSTYGDDLDVMAPGDEIYTTDLMNFEGNSQSNYFNNANGTSFAAPQVAAIAGLILSKYPNLLGGSVREAIMNSCKKTGGYNYATTANKPFGTWHQEMGYGLVDAYAALQAACTTTTINNQIFNNNALYKDCIINVNGSVVNNGINVQMQHITSTELKNGFEVKLGGSLEVKTQP